MAEQPSERSPQETMIRQWETLLMIPQLPARRSTTQIVAGLADKGYHADVRTVQRDLLKLSTIFAYTSEAEGRTNYWFFPRRSKVIEFPSMQPAVALALLLARDHLGNMVPPTTLSLLQPYFSRAESALDEAQADKVSHWRERVMVVSRGPALLSPRIREPVQRAIYEALLSDKQLQTSYRRRGAAQAKPTILHPQGLVLRDGVLYLVAMAWNYPYHYALHRFTQAEKLTEPTRHLPDFDLAAYVERAFHYPLSPKSIRLRLRMDADAAYHLEERPLAADQKVVHDEDQATITATVADTEELRWWLLGFGDKLEVLAPVRLRREIAATVAGMVEKYSP